MRFPLEVFEAVRRVWPEHKPLGVRVSATDWDEGGWTLEDSLVFSQALKLRGCDYICASSGGASATQTIPVGPGYQVRSEEHTSELQSLMRTSYAVFCLKKKTK